jgi:hypothetical protein
MVVLAVSGASQIRAKQAPACMDGCRLNGLEVSARSQRRWICSFVF